MAQHMIKIREFHVEDGFVFNFDMVDFVKHEKIPVAPDPFLLICKVILKCLSCKIPISSRILGNCRVYPIPSNHFLYAFLKSDDEVSGNVIVFMERFNKVFVQWFGPCKQMECDANLLAKVYRSQWILNEVLSIMNGSNVDMNKKRLKEKYWSVVREILNKIEAKKTDLKGRLILKIAYVLMGFLLPS